LSAALVHDGAKSTDTIVDAVAEGEEDTTGAVDDTETSSLEPVEEQPANAPNTTATATHFMRTTKASHTKRRSSRPPILGAPPYS
jgi:hypothetical protein